MMITVRDFFKKKFFNDNRTLFGLWLLIPVCAALFKLHKCNNFLIFRGSFYHLLSGQDLYIHYPNEYKDLFLYGPVFSYIIAPFAVMPVWMGVTFWNIFLAMILYWAIQKLPFKKPGNHIFILWFCAHDLLTSLFMQQFNVAIAALIIASFVCVEKEKDVWATFFILLGAFVKLYTIVGLAFFFFSRHKMKFIVSFLIWGVVLFLLPMLIADPAYIVDTIKEWFYTLVVKNGNNLHTMHQNVSLLGFIHKTTGCWFSDLWILVPALILFVLPYFRIGQYKNPAFRYTWLASVLMFVVLFSTGSESSTYIIPFTGVAIWYVSAPWKRDKWDIALMVFVFIFSSLSSSDLFPKYVKMHFMMPYAIKALPVSIVWFKLCYELCTKDYAPQKAE
ncbi:MAG: glycosyltransferase family 87 protein [Parabacteroides sp.]